MYTMIRCQLHILFYTLGNYQEWPAGYKNVYFNITLPTLAIWILLVCSIIISYETTKYLFNLYRQSRLRYSMLFLTVVSLYPHYYTFWAQFNIYNDGFYEQILHQMLFSVSELFSSSVIVFLCDNKTTVTILHIAVILTIASTHFVASCIDQFYVNVILKEGAIHQISRDVGFIISDISSISVPLLLYYVGNVKYHSSYTLQNIIIYSVMFMIIFITLIFII